jgi:hypothetical protein
MKKFAVGQPVVFIDSIRRRIPALIQCIHGEAYVDGGDKGKTHYPCVNIVFISQDPNRTDNYGRQIEHVTSISHHANQHPCVGFCWHFPDEVVEVDERNIATQR